MNEFRRPTPDEYAEYYGSYVSKALGTDLLRAMELAKDKAWETLQQIPNGRSDFRYAEDKWTVKDVFQHVNDCERIFSYRALCFARHDATAQPGFEENDYAANAMTEARAMHQIMREHDAIRASSIELYRSFTPEMLDRIGTANKVRNSVRALGWIIAGHAMHHMQVIEERYLPVIQ